MSATTMDVFFSPAYGKLYEEIEGGTCETFDFRCEFGQVRNVFIRRKVPFETGPEGLYDITTPYGYGGPVIVETSDPDRLVRAYEAEFSRYCSDRRIVSEFIRFHLFDNGAVRERFSGEVVQAGQNIVRSCDFPLDLIWMDFEHKVRKNVKRAQAEGLAIEIDRNGEGLGSFLEIYYNTMERNQASEYYRFSRDFFERLNRDLRGRYAYFHVLKNGRVVSTELVLFSQRYAYSFLGGTKEEFFALRPNDFLKYEIIRWCRESGIEKFVLGGGYRKDDGIFRYKKSFAPSGEVPFYVGRRVHDPASYEALVEERRKTGASLEPTGYFPAYRA
jgi:hypothetical protein